MLLGTLEANETGPRGSQIKSANKEYHTLTQETDNKLMQH
jgi:hypothetical protein